MFVEFHYGTLFAFLVLATWTIRPKIRSFRQYDFALPVYFSLADGAV